MYNVNVVVLSKWCQMESFLLQTTVRKLYYEAYRTAMTLSDLQGYSLQAFSHLFFILL